MAGPFSSTGNQAQDIERVQLKGGFSPDAGVAGVAAAIIGEAIPLITEAHAKDIREDITSQTESVKQALLAAQNPALRGSEFTEEALQNPITKEAFKQFNLIQDAASSGKLPKQYALERLEEIQDTAIANNPGFEKEIRAAMVQATGVDPNKATFQQMLNKSAADLSPEAKAERKTRELAAFHGITYEEQLHFNNVGARNQAQQAQLNLHKADGTYNLLQATEEVNLTSGNTMIGIMGQVQAATKNGTMTPEMMVSFVQQADAEIVTALSVIGSASSNVTGAQLTQAVAPLQIMRTAIAGMAEDGSLVSMTKDNVLMKKLMLEDNLMNMPSFAAAWTFGGPQGFQAILDYMALAPTQASEEVIAAMSPKVRDAYNLRTLSAGTVAKWYGNIGSGTKPETKEEKNAMRVAAALAMSTDGLSEDQKSSAMTELRDLGEGHEWSAFQSKKVASATKNSIVMTAAFLNLQEEVSTGLGEEFAQLQAMGKDKHISLQGNKLVFNFAHSVAGKTEGTVPGVTDTSAELAFIARFNRANDISSLHSSHGTLPPTRYTTTANYWDNIQTNFAVKAAAKSGQPVQKPAAQPVVIKYGRDSNGKSVRLN